MTGKDWLFALAALGLGAEFFTGDTIGAVTMRADKVE